MRRFSLLINAVTLLLLTAGPVSAGKIVDIGINAAQPPFSFQTDHQEGLIFDIVNALNSYQDTYTFRTNVYPTQRILRSPERLQMHIVAFNDENWGWSQRGGKGSLTLTDGMDVFVALKDNSERETIGAVQGYHYAFADYDPEKLAAMKNVTAVKNEEAVLELILRQRVDRGVISLAFLRWIKVLRPDDYAKLEIVDKPDHIYNRQFILFSWSSIDIDALNDLLVQMKEDGILKSVFAKYGLPAPPLRQHP